MLFESAVPRQTCQYLQVEAILKRNRLRREEGRIQMEEQFVRFFENLIARVSGPLHLRLLLQPLMATFFAVRAGLKDAREGKPAYFWAIFSGPPLQRKELLKEGWKAVGKVFVIAVIIDAVYQFIALGWFYPLEALIVAAVLALLPYLLFRGLVSRIARLGASKAKY